MTINKKSLISTLQTAKKANVASAPLSEAGDVKGTKGVKLARKARAIRGVKLARKAMAVRAARLVRLGKRK
jgi:hypothetical protein